MRKTRTNTGWRKVADSSSLGTSYRSPVVFSDPIEHRDPKYLRTYGAWNAEDSLKPIRRKHLHPSAPSLSPLPPLNPPAADPLCDAEEGKNDFPIRPIYLPDFARPRDPRSQSDVDVHNRVFRLRQALRQRFGGRPGLIRAFRVCGGAANGEVTPVRLQEALAQLNVHLNEREAALLVKQADAHGKGFLNFGDFGNLIFKTQPYREEVAAHHAVLSRVSRANKVAMNFQSVNPFDDAQGEACLVDFPKFRAAIFASDPTLPPAAVEYLWRWQWPAGRSDGQDGRVDYRSFLARLAKFELEHQADTPVYLQDPGVTQRQWESLGQPVRQSAKNEQETKVAMVASRLVFNTKKLDHKPSEVGEISVHYTEKMRARALRAKLAIAAEIGEEELTDKLKTKDRIARQEVRNLLIDFADEGDVDALLATAVGDVDDKISAPKLVHSVYHEQVASLRREIKDAFIKGHRKLRPVRPVDSGKKSATLASEAAELILETFEGVESGNGGKIRPIKIFRRLDVDGDGYLTMEDLRRAKKISRIDISDEHLSSLHASLDKTGQGSVSLAEFTAAFAPFQGNLVDKMEHAQKIASIKDSENPSLTYRVTDVKRARENSLLFPSAPGTRFGRTAFFDTRFLTEGSPDIPNNASFLDESKRFRTTYHTASRWTSLDTTLPQVQDSLRSEKTRNFRLQRSKWRDDAIREQREAGERAAEEFDRQRIALKAIRKIEYEERVRENQW